jgi:hypothetical protein
MKDGIASLIGFLGGTVITVWLLIALLPYSFTQAKDALEQCEKSLPRDQKCVIIAVPEDKK